MKRDKVIVSVPHTGTRFLKERLGTQTAKHTWDTREKVYGVCCTAEKIYAPLRHPREVYKSWGRRGRLHTPDCFWRWYTAWYTLQAVVDKFDVHVIPVDLQKDPLITDWRKVGDTDGGDKESGFLLREMDWQILFRLPVVREFYTDASVPRNLL